MALGIKEKAGLVLLVLGVLSGIVYVVTRRRALAALQSQQADTSSALGQELDLSAAYGSLPADTTGSSSASPTFDYASSAPIDYSDPALDNLLGTVAKNYQTFNQTSIGGGLDTITPVSSAPASPAAQAASSPAAQPYAAPKVLIAPVQVAANPILAAPAVTSSGSAQVVSLPALAVALQQVPATTPTASSVGQALASTPSYTQALQTVQQQGLTGGVFSSALQSGNGTGVLKGVAQATPTPVVAKPVTPIQATGVSSGASVHTIAGNPILTTSGKLVKVN